MNYSQRQKNKQTTTKKKNQFLVFQINFGNRVPALVPTSQEVESGYIPLIPVTTWTGHNTYSSHPQPHRVEESDVCLRMYLRK